MAHRVHNGLFGKLHVREYDEGRKEMKLVKLVGCLSLLILGTSSWAFADTITLGNVDGGTNPVADGVYVGPYAGTWNGSPVQMVCDDYSHEVFVGETWQAHASTFADLSHTRFWDGAHAAQSLQKYEMAAWLTAQIFLNPRTAWGDIGFAIWRIFTGSTPTLGNSDYWTNLAASQDLSHCDFSNFRILTPDSSGANSAQEYIVIVAPEPATMLLVVLGLVGLCLMGRKRAGLGLRTQ